MDVLSKMYTFTLKGYIVPYTRVTHRSKHGPRAMRYFTSQERIGYQLLHQMRDNEWDMLPESTPLWCAIRIHRRSGLHTSDLDNTLKAVLDASQNVIFKNDLWIDDLNAQRELSQDEIDICEFKVGVI